MHSYEFNITTDVAAHSSDRITSCYRLWSTIKKSAPRMKFAALQFLHLRTHAEYLSFKPRGKRNTVHELQTLWMLIDFSATQGRGISSRKKNMIGWIRMKQRYSTPKPFFTLCTKTLEFHSKASVDNVNTPERQCWSPCP